MQQSTVQLLINDLNSLSWTDKSILGIKEEEWLLMEVTPLPPREEIESVVMDIIEHREIDFRNGQVRRWAKNPFKILKSDPVLKEVVSRLEEQTFKIALLINKEPEFLMGQPVAFAIDPLISYLNFPDHPHLNVPGLYKGRYFPDSLCYGYTVEPERYVGTEYAKYIRAIDEITLWLFRHQIWEAYKKITGKGKWIGVHDKIGLNVSSYPNFLNPLGHCRCGKNISYIQCHFSSDLRSQIQSNSNNMDAATIKQRHLDLTNKKLREWRARVQEPNQKQFSKLIVLHKRVTK